MPRYAAYLCYACGLPGNPDSAVADEMGRVYDGAHEGCIDKPNVDFAECNAAMNPFGRRGWNANRNASANGGRPWETND